MTALSRRALLGGLCSCSTLALAGCAATSAPEGKITPGFRPLLASEEGALWHTMDKAEADLRNSRALIRDDELATYIHDTVCRLAADHCGDLRPYLLRNPVFNATAAPNGMLQIWSGLLLRTQNEAQFAAVLGHEIGHYLQRHSLQRLRDVEAKASAVAFLTVGFGVAGAAASLPLLVSVYSFNRDQEREADAIGFELMTKAGYRPVEAARMWEQFVAEEKADKYLHKPSFFFATHPASEERAVTLRAKADQLGATTGETYTERYQAHLTRIRAMLLDDELRLRQYDRSLVVIEAMESAWPPDGELAFYHGEVYRLRDGDGDRQRALGQYERAIGLPSAPPELHRSLGLVRWKIGDRELAQASFRKYLELRPNPSDGEMIRSYLAGQG
jgi:beta-barrel assembly-enhancing protease